MPHERWCKLLSAISLVSLIENWQILRLIGQSFDKIEPWILSPLMIAVPFLWVGAIAGLWYARSWGFIALYLYGALVTLFFGISLVPLILTPVPLELRLYALLVVNSLFLLAAAYLHRRLGRAEQAPKTD
ncbi:MAG: hypothetical protein R3245_11700 [Kiloniellales bacterium]|nr:hypothetical protein [Kiloniellales bacterium]